MAADVSVKMGVSGLQQFKQSMTDAQASVKTLDAALKNNEKTAKAYGQSESYLTTQTNLLNAKLREQGNVVKAAEQALKQMEANGVKTTSAAYQNMQRRLIEASTAMLETEEQIRNLGTASEEASGQTDQLAASLGGLNRKVSLEQVTSAIGSITSGLEKAGKKAVEVGKLIWENITDAARWGDDTATQAMILNMDVEDYQRYKKVFDTVGDFTVAEWQKMKIRVEKAVVDPSDDQSMIFKMLGISTHEKGTQHVWGYVEGAAKDYEDLFWEIGKRLREKVANKELTQAEADVYAQAIFGKGFAEMNPLLALGEEGFKKALEEQNVVTEESVNKLASLNDELIKLKGDFGTLKEEVLAGLAPALQGGAEVLDSLLGRLIEYLQTPEGKQALEDMGKAVEGLFSDLSKIDPEDVVEGFASVFNGIVGGLTWMSEHSREIIGALEAVVIGWGALKITGGALEIYKLIQGIMGLGGAATAAGTAGAAAGTAWGTAFANAVMAAAPWLIGLYTLLNPANTGNNDLTNASGLTNEGWSDFFQQRQRYSDSGERGRWVELIEEAAEIVEASAHLWDDTEGIQALARYANSGNKEQLAADLQALGYVLKAVEELPPALPAGSSAMDDDRTVIPMSFYKKWGAHLDAEEGAEEIAEQVGTVEIPVTLVVTGVEGPGPLDLSQMESYDVDPDGFHANGLWSVPFDGYHAVLHKGERIVPAREVAASRNFSSNLYVEKMIMNNGQDADGLAAAMAEAQRRTMAGYGN